MRRFERTRTADAEDADPCGMKYDWMVRNLLPPSSLTCKDSARHGENRGQGPDTSSEAPATGADTQALDSLTRTSVTSFLMTS